MVSGRGWSVLGARYLALSRPVLHLQPAHPPELSLVIGDQRQSCRQRVRSNPEIVVADHLALRLQLGTHLSVGFGSAFRQSQSRQQADQLPEPLQSCRPLSTLGSAVEQFAIRDDRKRRFSRTQAAESPQDLLRPALPDVDADVRVQQVARLHHRPLRFCGRSFPRPAFPRPAISKSSGRSASRSNATTMVPSFSRKTISSPRRKISTSSLFNRNCFGSRTA